MGLAVSHLYFRGRQSRYLFIGGSLSALIGMAPSVRFGDRTFLYLIQITESRWNNAPVLEYPFHLPLPLHLKFYYCVRPPLGEWVKCLPVNPSSFVAAADKIVRVSWWVGANYVCRQYCLGLAAAVVGVFSIIWINVCIVKTDSQLLIAIQLVWCLFFCAALSITAIGSFI